MSQNSHLAARSERCSIIRGKSGKKDTVGVGNDNSVRNIDIFQSFMLIECSQVTAVAK